MRDKEGMKDYVKTVIESGMKESGKAVIVSKAINEAYELGYKEAQDKYIKILEKWERESNNYIKSIMDKLEVVNNGESRGYGEGRYNGD